VSGSVLARAVVVLGGDSAELDKIMSAAEAKMMKVGERMQEIGETLTHKVTLPILALGALSVHAFGEQADAIARTNGVLKASGGVAGVTAEHMQKLASSLEETTTFADDVTQSAMAVLLSFQSVRNEVGKGNDVFDRTVAAAQDLSELMGKDLQGAMLMVGKSMEDPLLGLTQLRRVGVIFDDQTIETIKNLKEEGKVLEAQKMILDGLEKRVGGLAEVMAQTPLGQFKQAWNEVNNAMEDVGQVLAQVLVPASQKIKEWAKDFQGLGDDTKRAIVIVAGIAAAIGPMLIAVGTAIKLWTTFKIVLTGVAGPVALAIAAIGALIAAGLAIAENWTWLKQQSVALWAFIKDMFFTSVDFVLGAVQKFLGGLAMMGTVMKGMPGPLGAFGSVLDLLSDPLHKAEGGVQGLRDSLGEMADASMAASGDTLAKLENELMGVGTAAEKTSGKIDKITKRDPVVPKWLKPAQDALKAFDAAIVSSLKMEALFGDGFDETAARADAFQTVVKALADAGVPLDVALNKNGLTLRQLADQYTHLKETVDIEQAMQNFSTALNSANNESLLLGDGFDLNSAKADAYKQVIDTLISSGVNLDTVVGQNGETLRDLAYQYENLKQATEDADKAHKDFEDTMARAKKAVEDSQTPTQKYNETIKDLNAALAAGKITLEQYAQAVKHAGEVLDQATGMSKELNQALHDIAGRAVDDLVDSIFGAKKSFKDFVREAIMDISKLIIKMYIMRALFPESSGGKFLGGILGFAKGGFLPPGQIGMVGERGPELVMSGNNGMRITPLPALRASTPDDAGSGGGMRVEINVNAIDSRGVNEFFEQNEGLVAGAMMRAAQRSTALRRRLGG
jgi:tetratricopeptide (TPR) repeat protein